MYTWFNLFAKSQPPCANNIYPCLFPEDDLLLKAVQVFIKGLLAKTIVALTFLPGPTSRPESVVNFTASLEDDMQAVLNPSVRKHYLLKARQRTQFDLSENLLILSLNPIFMFLFWKMEIHRHAGKHLEWPVQESITTLTSAHCVTLFSKTQQFLTSILPSLLQDIWRHQGSSASELQRKTLAQGKLASCASQPKKQPKPILDDYARQSKGRSYSCSVFHVN
jgi:hypothetical protein